MSIAANLTPDESQQLIYSTLRSYSIPDPLAKLVTAQSGHETAGWTSNVYLSDNNAFGYGFNGSTYKDYPEGVEESVIDIVKYLNRRVSDGSFPALDTIQTADQYAALLKNAGYYTDTESNYSNGLMRWFNDNLIVAGGLSAGLIIFVVVLVYFLFKRK